jgi:hypothetical protein
MSDIRCHSVLSDVQSLLSSLNINPASPYTGIIPFNKIVEGDFITAIGIVVNETSSELDKILQNKFLQYY